MNISDLQVKGLVRLQYPAGLRHGVEESVRLWQRFCSLPKATKKGLPYSNGSDGVGYESKEGVGPKADRKENFDVTSSGLAWLKQNASGIDDPVALEFVQKAVPLVSLMKPSIMEFARQCENEYGLDGFSDEVEASEGNFFIRFIHYFGDREVGEETATAHTDQSGFTFHLFESHPGLQCLTYDGQWIDMPVSVGETVIIPSMQMQLRSNGKLKALCHRVIATPETAVEGRYSAVCFIQLKNTARYDKEKSGRLQEKTPGFNYDMTHEEFAGLFKRVV